MGPIFFRGASYTAKKRFFEGTHRILSPEETWEKIAPLAPKIGVTRVANITGLDRIGIPVTVAIRPGAITLSTSSGKGLSLLSAQVSGLMESMELYCAEEKELPYFRLSYEELKKNYPVISMEDLPLRKGSFFQTNWPERWTLGWDLIQQREVAIPLLSVLLNSKLNEQEHTEIYSFQMSSNGLSSGNHFLEALASGIYELIERDAVTCNLYANEKTGFPLKGVNLSTIPYLSVQEVLSRLEKKGVTPFLYDCTVETDVPVFMAVIHDQNSPITDCRGYGAHLDPEIAMIRALTEAVQGRTILIAGSRDDIFYTHFQLANRCHLESQKEPPENFCSDLDVSTFKSFARNSLEEDVHLLISKLQRAGFSQLIVVDLTIEELGVPVLRVIIPGMEDYYSESYHEGKRAIAFSAKQQSFAPASQMQKAHHLRAGALL